MSFLWVHEVKLLLREIVMTHTRLEIDNYRGNETKSHGSYTIFYSGELPLAQRNQCMRKP